MVTEMLIALGVVGLSVVIGLVVLLALAVHKASTKRLMNDWKLNMYNEIKEHTRRVDGMAGQYKSLKKDSADRNNKVGNLEKRVKELEARLDGDDEITGLVEKIDEVLISVDHILDNDWLDEDEAYTEKSTGTFSAPSKTPFVPAFTLNGKKDK